MRKTIMGIAGLGLMGAALIAPGTASATSIAYNQVSIAPAVLHDGETTEATSYTGADLAVSSSGAQTYAYGVGNGQYVAKPTNSVNVASASLASGSLKARAYLGFGANLPYNDAPYVPSVGYGRGFTQTSSSVTFGDSFQAYSGNSPFVWSDGTSANFHFAISGDTAIPHVIADTIGTPAELSSNTQIYSILSVGIYKPGTLDLQRQLNEIASGPMDDAAFAQFIALNDQITANEIARQYWYLGVPVGTFSDGTPISSDLGPNQEHLINFDGSLAAIDFDFTPDGDFDWLLQFNTTIRLDAALENTFVDLDYSHTIVTSYDGPDGATTYSASGVFPNTLALTAAPGGDVPEPASWALMLAGLGLLGAAARRRAANAVLLAA